MRVLHGYLLGQTVKHTLYALLFFTMVFILLDLFTNISTYIAHEISYSHMGLLSLLYMPKAVTLSLAPSILFSVTYTISSMHASNELVSILNSGISYYRFISVLLLLGLLMSVGDFIFQEKLVITTFAEKQALTQSLTGYSTSYNNSNVVLLSADQRNIYYARYYHDRRLELSGLTLIYRDENGNLDRRVDAENAVYDEENGRWNLEGVRTYQTTASGLETSEQKSGYLDDAVFVPKDFRNITYNIDEMQLEEAKEHLDRMQRLDLKRYRELAADYYERFSFALTPLIVVIISCSIGTRFKKNILLYSLLLCIIISLLYYVSEMLTMLLAKQGFLPPAAGGWLPVIFFTAAGLISLGKVRT